MASGGGASRPRFRLLPTVLLTAAILGLPTAVYAWGRTSSTFTIERVVVTGTRLVPERRALRLLEKDYLERNLFTVTNADVRATLEPLSYVETAQVDRDFPHTLRVAVAEHVPAAYVRAGGGWWVVADDGFVICAAAEGGEGDGEDEDSSSPSPSPGPAEGSLEQLVAGPEKPGHGLPRLAAQGTLKAGSEVRESPVRSALPVVTGLPARLRSRLSAVTTDGAGRLTLHFAGGPHVVWGGATRSRAKTLALLAVLKQYAKSGVDPTFLDVAVPDHVLGRPILK